MVVNSIFVEFFVSAVATLAPAPSEAPVVAADGPTGDVSVTLDGPIRGARPGDVRLFGRVEGQAPFDLTVNGEEVRVSAGGRWEHILPLGVGNYAVELNLTDATGAVSLSNSELLILPDYKEKDARPIVYVETAEELVQNLADKRILVLRPGDYVLNDVDASLLPAGCEKAKGTQNIILRGLYNIDFVGTGGLASRIVSDNLAGTALTLRDCEELNFYGLQIVHEPRGEDGELLPLPDKSTGGVVSLGATYIVRFRNCELSGEGVGVAVRKINAFVLADCVVRDCTGGGFRSTNSKHLQIWDTKFLRNGRGRPKDIAVELSGDRIDINFMRCTLEENQPARGKGLFAIDNQGIYTYFREGSIQNNKAKTLASGRAGDHLKVVQSTVQSF